MNIIPSHPYKTDSRAEYRFFTKLQESFIGDNSYTAFHSLNLTNHKTKRFGEADFVILCKFGLFVLEVKGGGVSYSAGHWSTVNKHREEHPIQDPFRQAEGALHAIEKRLKEQFPTMRVPIGYGVVFPDVSWRVAGSEWASETICDQSKFKNVESWLKKLFHYWQQKPYNSGELSSEQLKASKAFIRPDFELVDPLHNRIDKISEQAVKLTADQYNYLDIAVANKRVMCSGGAGTGKTFLAAELVKRLANEEKKVVLICKSSWLRYFLQSHIVNDHVVVSTIDSLNIDRKRAGVDLYDAVIVDEGQDLFDFASIELIDNSLQGGLEHGEWYIFHDVNNQAGLFIETKPEVVELLESYTPVNLPLTTNCRNTLPIIDSIKRKLSLDMGEKGTGFGPAVEFYQEKDIERPADALNVKLNDLLKNGVEPGAITILSPFEYRAASIKFLPDKLRKQIVELDDYSIRNFPLEHINFSEIKNFKGLENKVVLVIDLPDPKNEAVRSNKVLHYVALTRARAMLSVFWKPH